MIYKTIRHKDNRGEVNYICYTKEEAMEQGITFVPWQNANIGDWIISDNNLVAKCIQAKTYTTKKNRKNRYIKTAFGCAYYKPKTNYGKLILSNSGSPHNIAKKNNSNGERRELGKKLAHAYVNSNDLKWSINNIKMTTKRGKKYNWYKFSRTEEFKQMVREELNKLLAEKGFTESETLDLLNKTIGLAEEKKDTKTLAGIVSMLFKMHGIDQPTRVRETNELSAEAIEVLADKINDTEKEIEYHGKKQQITEGYKEN